MNIFFIIAVIVLVLWNLILHLGIRCTQKDLDLLSKRVTKNYDEASDEFQNQRNSLSLIRDWLSVEEKTLNWPNKKFLVPLKDKIAEVIKPKKK